MLYIKNDVRRKVLESFNKCHGVLHKLTTDKGEVFGYLSRVELKDSTEDHAKVAFSVSFNLDRIFDVSKMLDPTVLAPAKSKFYNVSDMKYFSMMHALKNNDDAEEMIEYSDTDECYEQIHEDISAILNVFLEKVNLAQDLHDIHDSFAVNTLCTNTSINLTQLHDYIFNKVTNIKKYYKNRKISLLFN